MDFLVPALAVAVIYSFMSLRVLRQYERGVCVLPGTFLGHQGAGPHLPSRRLCQPEAGLPPDRGAGHPAAGRDHSGQRLGQGERGAVHARE